MLVRVGKHFQQATSRFLIRGSYSRPTKTIGFIVAGAVLRLKRKYTEIVQQCLGAEIAQYKFKKCVGPSAPHVFHTLIAQSRPPDPPPDANFELFLGMGYYKSRGNPLEATWLSGASLLEEALLEATFLTRAKPPRGNLLKTATTLQLQGGSTHVTG